MRNDRSGLLAVTLLLFLPSSRRDDGSWGGGCAMVRANDENRWSVGKKVVTLAGVVGAATVYFHSKSTISSMVALGEGGGGGGGDAAANMKVAPFPPPGKEEEAFVYEIPNDGPMNEGPTTAPSTPNDGTGDGHADGQASYTLAVATPVAVGSNTTSEPTIAETSIDAGVAVEADTSPPGYDCATTEGV